MNVTTKTKSTSKKCATPGCGRPKYMGWHICEKCIISQKRATANDAAPGIEIKFWSPGSHIARAYVTLNGQAVGYVEMCSSRRAARGYYDQHRLSKGEDLVDESVRSTLPVEVEQRILDAIEACGGHRSLDRVFAEGRNLSSSSG